MQNSYIVKCTALLFCLFVTDSNAINCCTTVRKIDIVNNNNKPVQVDLTIPEYSEAQIRINKINPAKKANACDLLNKAILNESKAEIRKAIQAGADVNYVKGGMSPLVLALLLSKTAAFQYLLDCGAKPNKSTIEYAVKMGDIKSAYLLTKACGANINAVYPNRGGQPASLLQLAISCNDFEFALILVKNGANSERTLNGCQIMDCYANYYDGSNRVVQLFWLLFRHI